MALLAGAGRGSRMWKGPEMPAGLWHFLEFGSILGVGMAEWHGLEKWCGSSDVHMLGRLEGRAGAFPPRIITSNLVE